MSKKPPRCLFCGAEAPLLCDYLLGYDRDSAHAVRRVQDKRYTCDAPLCGAHAKHVAFFCGEESDTMDVCPVHADGDVLMDNRDKLVTAPQVKAWRRRMAIAIQNGMRPEAFS